MVARALPVSRRKPRADAISPRFTESASASTRGKLTGHVRSYARHAASVKPQPHVQRSEFAARTMISRCCGVNVARSMPPTSSRQPFLMAAESTGICPSASFTTRSELAVSSAATSTGVGAGRDAGFRHCSATVTSA
jgi:hypothetical protein